MHLNGKLLESWIFKTVEALVIILNVQLNETMAINKFHRSMVTFDLSALGPTMFVLMMILSWPWPTKRQGQICFLMHLNGIFLKSLFFEYW